MKGLYCMNNYEIILRKPSYLEITEKIGNLKFITDGKWDWEHGLEHYKRVAGYTKRILEQLNATERMIELGMVAALLHDIGLSISGKEKQDHALKSSQIFREFLVGTNISEEEMNVLEEAIKDHSNGNHITSLVGVALVLADKLDVTYHRTVNSSIQDEMNLEIQKIRKVDVIITENELIVFYETTGTLNFEILRGWKKAFTIPEKISKYLEKKYVLKVNGEVTNWRS